MSKRSRKKRGFINVIVEYCEIIHSIGDENLIFLNKVIEAEMEDRKLKISSDYDRRPKRSWIVRLFQGMGK